MLEEEYPQVPFNFKDPNGEIIFRDALTFANMTELRNTSKAEREAMMKERYDNWRAGVENPPQEELQPPEGP